MEMTIDTFYFGEVTLRDCFDPESSLNGEGYVEVTDTNNNVIAVIYGYSASEIEDMEQNEIEDLIDDNIL
ncbi:MAG: hypothetical protein MR904_05535 [Clostridia bacterium]|nr:hypothetical protein [Clostridia bacterium]